MNLNKAFVMGNLTRDPELRQTPSGQAVCSFGVATNRFYTDGSGQKQKQAEFHNIVAWGKQAEIVNQYLKKGSLIFVEGRLQTRNWQDPQGGKHYRTEIIAERVQLGPRLQGGAMGSEIPSQKMDHSPKDDLTPIIELPTDEDEIDVKEIPF
jgi:single-strand DNA-binding protein